MTRRNIFEIVNSERDPKAELLRIERLLNEDDGVLVREKDIIVDYYGKAENMSIVSYIDAYLFKQWKNRNTCISCKDFRNKAGIYDIALFQTDDTNYILNYCEYAANLVELIKAKINSGDDFISDSANITLSNIKTLLSWYGFELKIFRKEEKVLVVQKSAQATAVAEIVDEKLAYSVIDYNHFLLKGDIEKKKAILLSLGSDLESKRGELKKIKEDLEDNIFFMLNNLNIRHNNCSQKDKGKYKEYVANLKKPDLEKWYDELYQQILLAYLLLDNVERSKNVKDLRDKINAKQENDNGQT